VIAMANGRNQIKVTCGFLPGFVPMSDYDGCGKVLGFELINLDSELPRDEFT